MTPLPDHRAVDSGGAPPYRHTAGAGRKPTRRVPEVTTREEARSVDCPRCGAPVGWLCTKFDGTPRQSQHAERHEAAIANGARVIKRYRSVADAPGRGTSD